MNEKLLSVATEVTETVADPTAAEKIVEWFNKPNTQATLIVGGLVIVTVVVVCLIWKKLIKPNLR